MANRRDFLAGLAATAGLTALASGSSVYAERLLIGHDGRRPNIIVFLLDDLGWGDFGCYGNTFHETPNIDQLARESVRFTNAYAAAPVCSPSRAGLMTGQAPGRLHLTQWIPGNIYPHKKLLEAPSLDQLPARIPTLASELKKLDYRTCSIGKWHLGGEGSLPENFGFDVNVAGDNHGNPGPPNHYFGPFHYHNLEGYTKDDLLTEVLTQKMDEFLADAAKREPFFLYMAEYAVHMPLQERQALIDKYKKKNGGKSEPDPIYAAMVESVDTAFGNLRAKLKSLGVADNTVILLTSDNGGLGFQGKSLHRVADNGVLRAGKGFMYEGGIREPLLAYWPGITQHGQTCDTPVTFADFMPTILKIAGGKQPPQPCDGVDCTGLLKGGSLPDRTLYWHYPHYSDQGGTPTGGLREGDWKLIEFFEDGHLELYNLALDPGEQYDFSSSHQSKAEALQAKLAAWRRSVNAAMPKLNPAYLSRNENAFLGPIGCSAAPVPGCAED